MTEGTSILTLADRTWAPEASWWTTSAFSRSTRQTALRSGRVVRGSYVAFRRRPCLIRPPPAVGDDDRALGDLGGLSISVWTSVWTSVCAVGARRMKRAPAAPLARPNP